MHKRRRKRLTTRQLQQDPALLDDIHHGQVQCVLDRVSQWPFNAFTLDTVTGGRSLPVLCVHLFHWYGLMEHFNLDVVRIWKLFTLVEAGYHSTNPYHNSIHATDVTQAMHCFLQEEKIRMHLTPLEIMSSLIAAVTHDLDHPGVNQPFLIATSNHLAALYEHAQSFSPLSVIKNTSVLENHHWRSAIGCLLESNVAEQLGDARPELERQISSLILATDITRQQEFLTRFKRYLDQNLLDMRRPEDRHFILQIALKCADISNPCRPWDVSRKWSQKVCEEFFRQGDYERQLNLPVTSLCDRQTTSVPKIQAGFFRFVVSPLVEEWHRFLGTPLSRRMMSHLRTNQARWEALVQQELAEETRTEISDAEPEPELDEEDEVIQAEEEDGAELLPLPAVIPAAADMQLYAAPARRRHSVPLSAPQPPPVSRTVIRRESLPPPPPPRSPRRRGSPLPPPSVSPLSPAVSPQLLDEPSLSPPLSSSSSSGAGANQPPPADHSAENLLPEPSIASITTSTEASRLSSVLRGSVPSSSGMRGATATLTRQQTFPPLQPYVRARYSSAASASAAAELSEAASDSSDPPASPPRRASLAAPLRERSHQPQQHCKREQSDCPSVGSFSGYSHTDGSAPAKLPKLSPPPQSQSPTEPASDSKGGLWEKENVDPDEICRSAALRRNGSQALARRRGSAPVALLLGRAEDPQSAGLALRGGGERFLRRGSVPVDVNINRQKNILRSNGTDVLDTAGTGRWRTRKKMLRRRSSGGPEMFGTSAPNTGQRRGSLPGVLSGDSSCAEVGLS
ncbi:cAMP-specific 3',5'-cyclic phosphodiesterase 4A-like isoform X3 [Schistocerca piceifrons]|uniref:cAMP-specific 3',5'-cyclic phosphodiesterase 4A-like isoform X3 n=1 Tax=Schistocerca piceifrons TaxID=274613 RepID=UPI001F5F48B6|nr:cAMP-specific 3',5'-cyclic phosphodiesterase 4A-like isoform X3 [Schistocerca piceifrons]